MIQIIRNCNQCCSELCSLQEAGSSWWSGSVAKTIVLHSPWCKRLAQQFDPNQLQRNLLLMTINFERCSKNLLLFWTSSLQKKTHNEKSNQWSFALDCPLCKRSVQLMIQIACKEDGSDQHDLQDATPWTMSSFLTQTSEYCCIESFYLNGTGWSRWFISLAETESPPLSCLPGASFSRWSGWFAK